MVDVPQAENLAVLPSLVMSEHNERSDDNESDRSTTINDDYACRSEDEHKSEDDLELYKEMTMEIRSAAESLRTCRDAVDAVRVLKQIEQAIHRDEKSGRQFCESDIVDSLVDANAYRHVVRLMRVHRAKPQVLDSAFSMLALFCSRQTFSKTLPRRLARGEKLFEFLTEALSTFTAFNVRCPALYLAFEILGGGRTCEENFEICAEIMAAAGTIEEVCKVGAHALELNEAHLLRTVGVTLDRVRGACKWHCYDHADAFDIEEHEDPFEHPDTAACARRYERAVNADAVRIIEATIDIDISVGDFDEKDRLMRLLERLRIVQTWSMARQSRAKAAAQERADAMAAELLAEEASKATATPSTKKKSKARAARVASAGSSTSQKAAPTSVASPGRVDGGGGRRCSGQALDDSFKGVDVSEGGENDSHAASDTALRTAAESGELAAIVSALEAHVSLASDAAVAHARAVRDRLREKRKKESQRQRRMHAAKMKEMQPQAPDAPTAAVDAVEPSAVDAPMVDGLFVPPLELVRSLTNGFAEELRVGTGGCAVVYRATSPAGRALAIKRASNADADTLAEMEREMELLRRCDHPHLLPLLGCCRDPEALCLIFPLMQGGSLEARLFPSDEHLAAIQRLGHFTTSPKPLTWRQRLRVLHQSTRALLHMHALGCVHRDFKPANILLRADLHAMLSDTGFAKTAADNALQNTRHASITSRGVCHTTGYADPLITSGGGFSERTDAYAVGVTLLVCLSGRPAVRGNDGIFDAIEEDHEQIFGEIDPPALADSRVGWPAAVCRTLVPLVLSTEKSSSLCNPKKFKRLPLADAVEAIARLAAGPADPAAEADATAAAHVTAALAHPLAATPHASAASMLVRDIARKAAGQDERTEQERRLQQKASEGFKGIMARLERIDSSAAAPAGFEERIRDWHARGMINKVLHGQLHELRRWRNAAEHNDSDRWRAEGPKDDEALMQVLRACDAAVTSMEA